MTPAAPRDHSWTASLSVRQEKACSDTGKETYIATGQFTNGKSDFKRNTTGLLKIPHKIEMLLLVYIYIYI